MAINPATLNILIVDDYKTMLRVIYGLLKQIGFSNIDEATDGTMALELIKKKQYGLIISDWNMEPMSGLDLLKNIRAQDNKVPFIMVTAESKAENIMVAREAKVNNYIVKPFSAEILKKKITAVLGEF
ncbi:MAG: response regulator [Alphaproteobacteria bacterium]